MSELPRAILFDLDDTLISAYREPERAWRTVANEFEALLPGHDPAALASAIVAYSTEFWADAKRHRYWRMRLYESRREIVRGALRTLSSTARAVSDEMATRIADRFTELREQEMFLFPEATETLDGLRERGTLLALVTNGPSDLQRGKIARFDLERRFDHIQIEGEHEFGKPDARAYLHAMQTLSVTAADTWMVGDNLEWEVRAPQRLGIYSIWHDVAGQGLPEGSAILPNRIIRTLRELLGR